MVQAVLLIVLSAGLTWFVMTWARSRPAAPKALTHEEGEIDRAKDIGTQLDGARDRASVAELRGTSPRNPGRRIYS